MLRFKQWQFSKTRLETFCDAVFAIVMTLLVLELKLPHIHNAQDVHEVIQVLKNEIPIIFSWAVSFFIIAIIWLHHHSIMHMATKSDYGVIWINIFLLFFICLLPFPSALMGQYPHSPVFVMLWGLTLSASTWMLTWLYYYNAKNYLDERYDKKSVIRNIRFSILGGPVIYFAAAMLAWVSVYVSLIIYALVPFLYITPLDKEINREKNAARKEINDEETET